MRTVSPLPADAAGERKGQSSDAQGLHEGCFYVEGQTRLAHHPPAAEG